jgi:PAS domain S-box-containing protein
MPTKTSRGPSVKPVRPKPDLFRLLVEGVKEYAIFMLDPAGIVVSWNTGAQRIKGYRSDEIIGQHFSVFYPPEDVRAGKPATVLQEAAARGSVENEGWRIRKDGSRFWAQVVITALLDDAGALTGFAKITRDLTERRRAIDARRSLQEAREAVRTRDDFLAIASHELRTPLTVMKLSLDSLVRSTQGAPVTAGQMEKLASLGRHVNRLGDLVNGLLDVATLTSGRLSLDLARCDLVELVREVVGRFEPEARRRGTRIELAIETVEAIPCTCDRGRVGEALAAILANALKYGGVEPIRVRVAREDGRAVISVEDRGPGIAMEDQARVFERFERAVPVVHYGGFGVGLWTARQIVTAHGGEIEIRSVPGQGSWFGIRVPVERSAA